MTRWLKVDEYSKRFNKHPQNVRDLCREGHIAGAMKIGKTWRIPVDEDASKENSSINKTVDSLRKTLEAQQKLYLEAAELFGELAKELSQ